MVGNIICNTLVSHNMKEIDDTPLPESESVDPIGMIDKYVSKLWQALDLMNERMEEMNMRIAKLESRRILQADPNDDEEWY